MNTFNKTHRFAIQFIVALVFSAMMIACKSKSKDVSTSSTSQSLESSASDHPASTDSSALSARDQEAVEFAVTVFRQYPDKKCTSGYLAVSNEIICYTVEKPWKDNQQNVSSIPAGKYAAILRYDHTDHWRIELLNVPNRTNIQIHVGNTVNDIEGCILVGEKLNADLCSLAANTSKPAYKKLKKAFYGTDTPTSTPNKNISVEIKDAGPQ